LHQGKNRAKIETFEKDAVCYKSSDVRQTCLMSDVLEVSYVFNCNDVGKIQTVTVDIKRIHSVDIVSIGIEI